MKRVLLCVALLAFTTMASAAVYRWVDAAGHIQYGDTPPDGVKAELVHLAVTRASSEAAPAPASSAPSFGDQALAAQHKAEQQQQVAADVAAARQKQCADAKAHYEELINGRHMYTLGKNGERDYLSSAQIDAARLSAKQQVDSLCKSDSAD
ncbi:MAG: DUF4124 domain-containing protein [Gammaproteobacteria bacterium]|nr:DUF4124 domain-containing protein [Gammaproteobacteria bacterium]